MDNLDMCMIQCKKDGYGVHYGAWRAAQKEVPVFVEEVPQNAKKCPWCGEMFVPNSYRRQLYCGAYCSHQASYKRHRQSKKERGKNEQA